MKGELTIKVLPRFEVPSGAAVRVEPQLSNLWRNTVTFMFDVGERVVDMQDDRIGTVTEVCMQSIKVHFDGHDGAAQFRLSSLDQLALLRAFADETEDDEPEETEDVQYKRYIAWKELTQ
jgi:hypothetical protein